MHAITGGIDPANRGGAFERRSIGVLDPILRQEEADGHDLSDSQEPRKTDRRATAAQVLGFRVECLP